MARAFAASAATCVALLSLSAMAGCGGTDDAREPFVPPPLLYVTPATAEVVAGGGAITFTALLRGAGGIVYWSLEPAGVGMLSATSGASVAYLPPSHVASTAAVTLTARTAGMSDWAAITVVPPSPPSLMVTPATACLVAGDGPTTFAAQLENALGAITWSLAPSGIGDLSATSGAAVEYTPPAAIAAPANLEVVATGAGLTSSAAVTVAPAAPCASP